MKKYLFSGRTLSGHVIHGDLIHINNKVFIKPIIQSSSTLKEYEVEEDSIRLKMINKSDHQA